MCSWTSVITLSVESIKPPSNSLSAGFIHIECQNQQLKGCRDMVVVNSFRRRGSPLANLLVSD